MLSGIKLIIYDLDGTLIDSTDAIIEVFNQVVAEQSGDICPAETIREMIGLPLTEMFRRVLPKEKPSNIQACWDRYIAIYDDVGPRKTRILPRVIDTLAFFEEKGFLQSVATTKRSDVATSLLGKLNMLNYFDLVLGINDVVNPKPAPDIIRLSLNKLEIKPWEAVFVEDTTIGLEAGKSSGVHTIGVTTGTHDRVKLSSLHPDYVIDCISELMKIVVSNKIK